MTAFKIGQSVNLIGNYNDKGCFYIKAAEVHSCGPKRMILTCAHSGEEANEWFKPARVQSLYRVVADASENAEEIAISLANSFIADEIARLEKIMATPYFAERHNGDGYAVGYGNAIIRNYEAAKAYAPSFFHTQFF